MTTVVGGCDALVGMDAENLASQPPDDEFVPWKPAEAVEHLEMLRDFRPDNATAESTANLALTIVKNMQCPHTDCPMLVTEHHAHR